MRIGQTLSTLALALSWCTAALAETPAPAAATPTECDRLAGHPSDPDKVVEGVSQAQVLSWQNAAIRACELAVAAEPGNARVRYQLGRVHFYAGRQADALPHLEAAAAARHRQAQFVLGLFYADGVKGVLEADACRALALWQDAASRQHFAARVALGRDYVRGAYDACETRPSKQEVAGYLESAGKEARDYYQRLLISWAQEALAARS
jgi:TPR repeat protein